MSESKLAKNNVGETDPLGGTFKPQLTSLIDVMTLLLAFLIMTFSVEGNLITPAPDLVLPLSESRKNPRPLLTLEISKTTVISGGTVIEHINALGPDSAMMVPSLFQFLKRQPVPDDSASRSILIQADKSIEFSVLKKIMYTCSKAGFGHFSVLVIENG